MYAVTFDRFGDPSVLEWKEVPDPAVASDEVLVRVAAAGLNFADVYRRQGRFSPPGEAPWINGFEGAGEIVELGKEAATQGWSVGDRVAWADCPRSNAELVSVSADRLLPVPDSIALETAGALALQGMTAHYLVQDSHPVAEGQSVVVHAAGGGVGLLLTQLAKARGGRVIAIASTAEKRAAALEAGAEQAIAPDGWVEHVRELSGGGADVVYDSVGSTILDSLAATRNRGRAVFYGVAGGQPPEVPPLLLMERSLTLTGGDLWSMISDPETRRARARELFDRVAGGSLTVRIAGRYPMSEAGRAHAQIESRQTIGKILLIPDAVMAA